jgi:lipoic acid synthetase
MARYASPDEFERWALHAREKQFLGVASSPLTRSSYHADADFEKLAAARRRRAVPQACAAEDP